MIQITIPSSKSFLVHLDLLTDKSRYFRKALTGNFSEAKTTELTLEEDVSDVAFVFFLKWLYGGSLRPANCHSRCSACSECRLSWANLFEIWFFADYTLTDELKSHVIQNLIQKITNFKFSVDEAQEQANQVRDALCMLWAGKKRTDKGEIAKPLRDLLLDFIGNPWFMTKAQNLKIRKEGLPTRFLCELGIRSIGRNFDIQPKIMSLVSLSKIYDSDDGMDADFNYDRHFDQVFEMEDVTAQLVDAWMIKPEKYYAEAGPRSRTQRRTE